VVVEGACAQQFQHFQHFISNSPWQHEPVVEQIARDVDGTVGGKPDSCLLIDETSFVKQGNQSVGVARQWCGRLGKVDNCQVAVFAVLADGQQQAPVDVRLYLPKKWIDDPQRCDQAGVPASARQLKSKTEHALDMVRAARARGLRFGWVGADGGYGKEPAFLRALDDANETFVVDVHRTQSVWLEDPKPSVSAEPTGRKGRGKKLKTSVASVTVEHLVRTFGPQDWRRHVLRDSTRGPLQVDVACRRVWLWDGEESGARHWHLIVRREVKSPETIKYSLSNAPAETPHLPVGSDARATLLGRAQLRGRQRRVRSGGLPGSRLGLLAPPYRDGYARDVDDRPGPGHSPAATRIAERARCRRDPQRDLATQAGRQGCSVAPDQRTPPTPAQRHPVALSWPAKIRPLTGPTNVTLSN